MILEGIKVDTDVALEVALNRAAALLKENVFMEAALNGAHDELDRLRKLQEPASIGEVVEDGISRRS